MNGTDRQHRTILQKIAHRVMLERGLLPDFSNEALAELASFTGPAQEDGASIRDMRDLLWASIDNDDSLDLDQLTVAGASSGGSTKVFVAVADVDSLVKPEAPLTNMPGTIPPPSTPQPKSFPCCRKGFPPTSPR